MAEESEYRIPKATVQEIDKKTVEVDIRIPNLEVKAKIPGIGTAKLKDNCTVTTNFEANSLQITAIIKKNDIENKFKYDIRKLPGEIIPEKCTTKYKDDLITVLLHKAEPSSWEIQLKRGLEQAKD
ncbi:Hypothetical predicted protein [Mytilus galloprovincialis]|uniref:CS domain-containing protein n=1 Tax=Mytilus galloprovincialis TaxID=29158 RepID=A0A8B6DIV7_MYTGA|nr:Hypothetical predicted protein [Mytilus galloprovincialis]